jgi:RND superfamily putative drug exporter
MLQRYARFVVGHRRAVLVVSVVGLLVAAVAFVDLGNRVTLEGFVVRSSESFQAKERLDKTFGVGLPNVVFVVTARSGAVDDAAASQAGAALTQRLAAEPGVKNVASYFSPQRPSVLLSRRGNRALIVARITGSDREVDRRIRQIAPRYRGEQGAVDVNISGYALFLAEGADVLQDDLSHAELVTAPITLLALLVVFGSLVAAFIPLGVAMFVVLGTGLVLWLISLLTPVSSFSLFFTTVLGLGLAIDYSLFVISRFREELSARGDPEEAAVATIMSAGHTVMFSAAAVGVALAGLLLIPLQFMRSLGFAGLGTAAVAGTAGLVVMPALLATLGERVNRGRVWGGSVGAGDGRDVWYRTARRVMRRPRVVVIGTLLILLSIGSYARHLDPGLTDDRLLGTNTEVRHTGDILRTDFDSRAGTPVPVVLPGVDGQSATSRVKIDRFAKQLLAVAGVLRVDTVTGGYTKAEPSAVPGPLAGTFARGGSTYLSVTSAAEPLSDAGRRQISDIRRLASPFERVQVTGDAAVAKDVTDAVTDKLPLALVFVAIASFVALMLQTRSIAAPLLAIALSLVSLSVLYAFLVYVFQDGHFSDALDFEATGTLYVNIAILLFCFAYGLSMDYQVFLYSRIREEWDRSHDHEGAIAYGLGRSGRIMSAAAVLIALVFLSFGLLGTTFFGASFGLALGAIVLLDAFVIRGTLVPAAMKLIGPRMWWAPSWLTPRTPAVAATPVVRPGQIDAGAPRAT